MRILIAAPPKAGNSWLKCLLGHMYGLTWLRGDETPATTEPDDYAAWVAAGKFPDGTIFHHHYDCSPAFCDAVEATPAHLVTIVRDPYDSFVSLYHFVQAQAAATGSGDRDRREKKRQSSIVGKPIDDPAVLDFLRNSFASVLDKAIAWAESDRTAVVRYEGLHDDPQAELRRVAARLGPVDDERIAAAIAACDADAMRRDRPGMSKRIRSATVGDWRNHLTDAHLQLFRDEYAPRIERLGYPVQ